VAAQFILYVRGGCHLCEQFLLDFSLDYPAAARTLQLRDVDLDPHLAVRFGLRVPVLEYCGTTLCEGAYDRVKVERFVGL